MSMHCENVNYTSSKLYDFENMDLYGNETHVKEKPGYICYFTINIVQGKLHIEAGNVGLLSIYIPNYFFRSRPKLK